MRAYDRKKRIKSVHVQQQNKTQKTKEQSWYCCSSSQRHNEATHGGKNNTSLIKIVMYNFHIDIN